MELKKIDKKLAIPFILLLFVFTMPFATAPPADPGHGAAAISAGTFEAGNFTFPNWLNIKDILNVSTMNPNINLTIDSGTFFVDASGDRVGIGTTGPGEKLDVSGDILVSGGIIRNNEFTDYANIYGKLVYRRYSHSAVHPTTTEGMTDLIKGATFVSQGVTADINGFTFSADNYAVEFVGYFYAASTGTYTFGVNSDDASDLFIDGKLVAYWYDSHGANAGATPGGTQLTAYLKKGYHRLYTRFEEGSGGDSHMIVYKTPGSGTWVVIPSSVLFHGPNDLLMGSGDDLAVMSGKVGIGTSTPQNTLNVVGTINGTGYIYSNSTHIVCTAKNGFCNQSLTETDPLWTGNFSNVAFINKANAFQAYNQSFDTNVLYVDASGNRVGIGTSSPAAKLDVRTSSGGALIAGGGTISATGDYAVALGYEHSAPQYASAALGGGYSNVNSTYSAIVGGYYNKIYSDNDYSAIVGGSWNEILTSSSGFYNYNSVILGGRENKIINNSQYSAIVGGYLNKINNTDPNEWFSGIFVGSKNNLKGESPYSVILGGIDNNVTNAGAAILGGYHNSISGNRGVILGGDSNTIASGGHKGIILAGQNNTVSSENAIAGGYNSSASGTTSIALGDSANASGSGSVAIGTRAKANQTSSVAIGTDVQATASYAFVLGEGLDSANPLVNNKGESFMVGFASTSPTLFVNGTSVGIGTTTPGARLHVTSPFASEVNGTVVKLGGKSSWTSGTYERFQFGFSQLDSIWNSATPAGWDLAFRTGASDGAGTEKMRITRGGNVGINTTDPQAKLEVKKVGTEAYANGPPVGYFGTDTANTIALVGDASSGSSVSFPTGASIGVYGHASGGTKNWAGYFNGDVYTSGNVGIGTTTLGEKLTISGGNISLTTADSKITGATGLTLEETGDTYGTVRLNLQNRWGVNGAMFEQAGTVDLVDFVFKSLSNQRNIRFEDRSTAVFAADPEFQIGPSGNPTLVVGDSVSAFRSGNVGIGTSSPTAFTLQVAGHVGPDANNSYDLGSSTKAWRGVYRVNEYAISTPEAKQDIEDLDEQEESKALAEIVNTPLHRFRFKGGPETAPKKLGIMATEAPGEVKAYDEDGRLFGINVDNYMAMLHASIKAQQREIEGIKIGKISNVGNASYQFNLTEGLSISNATILSLNSESIQTNSLKVNGSIQAQGMKAINGNEKIRFENGNVYVVLG